ncbi:MAG TPA: tRNA (adenosine(37)-N6)-threonylcarbamoyltransferase complex dimerization subunit type 1 TsaB [Stellaceae bacterium]|nr:tRNA (adenosine(37)-N6)-threonylcarbamoyltransferase complex dimerization subunit type 1 TsaB [Stellaceae bacterium]
MNVLALDCAGRGCAAAVLTASGVAARRVRAMERGQAEALMPMIDDVLAEASMRFADLDLLAVTVGPGSFTGVRIGLAAARGLALATGLPLVGITSFAAAAAGVPPARRGGRPLAVALDSKREEIFLQVFAPDGPVLAAGVMVERAAIEAALPPGPVLVAGDAAARLVSWVPGRAALASGTGLPDPGDIARLALASWRPGQTLSPPRPLYLRAPDTTPPRAAKVAG